MNSVVFLIRYSPRRLWLGNQSLTDTLALWYISKRYCKRFGLMPLIKLRSGGNYFSAKLWPPPPFPLLRNIRNGHKWRQKHVLWREWLDERRLKWLWKTGKSALPMWTLETSLILSQTQTRLAVFTIVLKSLRLFPLKILFLKMWLVRSDQKGRFHIRGMCPLPSKRDEISLPSNPEATWGWCGDHSYGVLKFKDPREGKVPSTLQFHDWKEIWDCLFLVPS